MFSFGWWLVLICSERKILVVGGWFVLREKYGCLVADKPNEQGGLEICLVIKMENG
jgi:hypothetical protein